VTFNRSCDEAVDGTLPSNFRKVSVIRGPIAFVWLAEASTTPASAFGTDQKGHGALKVLVLVKEGWQVTVAIGEPATGDATLFYDPSHISQDGRYQIDQGDTAVGFSACPGHQTSWAAATQFNGSIVARGPLCLALSITGSGAGSFTDNVQVPVGRGAGCPPPSAT
jgi:hypothetical protein